MDWQSEQFKFLEELYKKKSRSDDIKTQLARFLYHYRSTPQASTGVTPAELLTGRPLRTHLELLKPDLAGKERCSQILQKMARDGRSKQRVFFPSETVYIRNSDKESQWIPGFVESKLGDYTYLIRLDNNQTVRRHIDHI